MFENLEFRRLLSVTLIGSNEIRVTGLDRSDVVSVHRAGEEFVVVENGRASRIPAAGVTSLIAMTNGGGDRVTLLGHLGLALILVDGGAGNDRLVAGSDPVNFSGGEGNDRLIGGPGDDVLGDPAGNNQIVGGAGDDNIGAGRGRDRLSGGAGNDTVAGGHSGDGTPGSARPRRNANVLSGDDGADRLLGGDGHDLLLGGAGDDAIEGGGGNDVLVGGDGDDRLVDEVGRNNVQGGGGWDVVRVLHAESRVRGADVVELVVPPAGDAAPADATIDVSVHPDGTRSATVTVGAAAGDEVVWATLPAADPSRLRIGVSVRTNPESRLPAFVQVTRTFEVGRSHEAVVVADARTNAELARADLARAPEPGPATEPRPIALQAEDTGVRIRRTPDGLEAVLSVSLGHTPEGVTFGAMTRDGDEFFLDVSAEVPSFPSTAPSSPAVERYALGALGPGSYVVNVRSRTGIVEIQHFLVRPGP